MPAARIEILRREGVLVGIQCQRRVVGKVFVWLALSFPSSTTPTSHPESSDPTASRLGKSKPHHHRQGRLRRFSELVKFRLHYARSLSDGLATGMLEPCGMHRLTRWYPVSNRINRVAKDDEECSVSVETGQPQAHLF
jgi:hypothetical protein